MGGRVEVALLSGAEAGDGVGAQLNDGLGVGWRAADAGGGYVVGVGGEALLGKALAARLDESAILGVDIAHEKPCAHAVGLKGGTVLLEDVDIGEEGLPCLHVGGVGGGVVEPHGPYVAVAVVGCYRRLLVVGHFGAALQVDPQGELRAVERRLLYVGDGALPVFFPEGAHLVGGVAEEIALEDWLGTAYLGQLHELLLGLAYAGQLGAEHL